ncbi:hypothetical protein QP922_09670 [Corynebacterium sp. MSK218]|uniref:hypothetical protein n=1 Tax=Corynebacterium sp. MSK218 TaxID=3050218 RepID=UPI0025506D54|nr:hypothetical protein [Corynebacterium sp. MSK218]MDK8764086.1 hypothetical protein [Corynebacterium sp. MSK218]
MNHRDTAQQYQRRHAAALRLPPLDNGHRDPATNLDELKTPSLLTICELAAMGAPVTRDMLVEAWHSMPDARPVLEAAAKAQQDGWR